MSLTKNLTLKKRTKVVEGTFFQLSGAILEILVSLSTKKNSLSDERERERDRQEETGIVISFNERLLTQIAHFTINVSKAEVKVFHQVGVSDNHIKHVPASGFHLAFDGYVLTVWHHHSQFSLRAGRFPLFWLRREKTKWKEDRALFLNTRYKLRVQFLWTLTKMDPGSSKTTTGSSDILINSGPISYSRDGIIHQS